MLALRFYDVIVSLHVLAVFAAFGVVFAYPVLVPYVLRRHPGAAPALYGGMVELNRKLVTPAAVVALLAGAYLATDAEVWDEVWVTVPLLCLVALMGLVGAVFTPSERRLSERTARELGSGAAGEAPWSPETLALVRKDAIAGAVALALVVIAVFFMVAKPFA